MASKLTASGYIDAKGSSVFYEREGDSNGQTILFIHGLGGTTNGYQPLVPELQDFDLVRYDWAGHGRSASRTGITVETYVENAESVIDHLKLKNVVLVGHSVGGLVALHLAARRPEQVKSLVLLGPVLPPPEAGQKGLKARSAGVREGGMASVADTVVGNAFSPVSYTKKRGEVALAREMLARTDVEGYAQACEAVANAGSVPWDKIKAPATVLNGKDDKVSTVETGEKVVSNLGNDAKQHVLEEVGHWYTLEAPGDTVSYVRQAAQ